MKRICDVFSRIFGALDAKFQICLRWDLKMANFRRDLLLQNWKWHDRSEEMFHPSEAKDAQY